MKNIRDISMAEHPDVTMSNIEVHGCALDGEVTATDVTRKVDCHVYRNFLEFASLKGDVNFMAATFAMKETAQTCASFWTRDICREHHIKMELACGLSTEYRYAILALKDDNNFSFFTSPAQCPD